MSFKLLQVFKDVDKQYSSKRVGFFLILALWAFIALSIIRFHYQAQEVSFAKEALEMLTRILMLLGGAIVAERVPMIWRNRNANSSKPSGQ